MHPELIGALADARRRELTSRAVPLQAREYRFRTRERHSRSRATRALVPGYRVTWTRLSLAPADAGQRRSWVIVISATRAR